MTEQEILNNIPEGATHYLEFPDDIWYIKWSNLLAQFVVKHENMWVTFSTSRMKEIKKF